MWAWLRRNGWALLSGTVLGFCFPRWALFPLAWVALVPLFLTNRNALPRESAGRFFVAGMAFNAILFQWLMTNVYWAGGWAFLGYLTLCVIMSAYWGLLGGVWCWMRKRLPWTAGAVGLAVLWTGMEYLQARLFTGFGWGAIGYTQGRDFYVLQWASIGGVSLVSFLLALANALISESLGGRGARRFWYAGTAVAVVLASHGIGILLVDEPDYERSPFRVGLFQADFPLEMKYDREYVLDMVENAADKSRQLRERSEVDLFVWPEALIMDEITTPEIKDVVTSLTRETGTALFTGADRYNKENDTYPNSSYLVEKSGEIVDYYDKVHLVPFGEYMPFAQYLPFARQVVPAIGEVGFGNELKTFTTGGRRFGPLICFEVLFAQLSEKLRAKGADMIIVITNLGWFGDSSAIPQEFELARVRAVETRLPLVHCANTGITGVFDPWGRFTMVNGTFDQNGQLVMFRNVAPERTIMQRVAGVLPVPAPGKRPIAYGPVVFPWGISAISLILIGIAAVAGRKPSAS